MKMQRLLKEAIDQAVNDLAAAKAGLVERANEVLS